MFDNKKYDKCEQISSISNDVLLTEFKNITDKLANIDNIGNIIHYRIGTPQDKNKYELNPNNDWYVLRVLQLRGHKGLNDFYTLISNNQKEIDKNTGIYKDISKIKTVASNTGNTKYYLEYYFAFNTKNQLTNFINYIKTDFVRCILFIYKNTMNILRGELTHIPMFNFSNNNFSKTPKEIDDYLFTKYHISNDIRKHIEKILPDYYNIRKGRD